MLISDELILALMNTDGEIIYAAGFANTDLGPIYATICDYEIDILVFMCKGMVLSPDQESYIFRKVENCDIVFQKTCFNLLKTLQILLKASDAYVYDYTLYFDKFRSISKYIVLDSFPFNKVGAGVVDKGVMTHFYLSNVEDIDEFIETLKKEHETENLVSATADAKSIYTNRLDKSIVSHTHATKIAPLIFCFSQLSDEQGSKEFILLTDSLCGKEYRTALHRLKDEMESKLDGKYTVWEAVPVKSEALLLGEEIPSEKLEESAMQLDTKDISAEELPYMVGGDTVLKGKRERTIARTLNVALSIMTVVLGIFMGAMLMFDRELERDLNVLNVTDVNYSVMQIDMDVKSAYLGVLEDALYNKIYSLISQSIYENSTAVILSGIVFSPNYYKVTVYTYEGVNINEVISSIFDMSKVISVTEEQSLVYKNYSLKAYAVLCRY
jgi:hypothetical protein